MLDISKIKDGPFCPYFNCYCDESDSSKCKECSFYKETAEAERKDIKEKK